MGIGKAFLLIPLMLGLNGCLGFLALNTVPTEEDAPEPAVETVVESEAESEGERDNSFGDAVNAAMAASESAQTAKTAQEWVKAADRWATAIEFMRAVPTSSENYQTAQQKVSEYQANYNYASKNASAAKADESASAANKVDEAVESVKAYLLVLDPNRELLLDAQIIGDDDHHLGIAVKPAWALTAKQTQELFLSQVGESWQKLRSPDEPNEAIVFVVDTSNNKILGRYDAGGPHLMD